MSDIALRAAVDAALDGLRRRGADEGAARAALFADWIAAGLDQAGLTEALSQVLDPQLAGAAWRGAAELGPIAARPGGLGAEALAQGYAQALRRGPGPDPRKRSGAFYTPPRLARWLAGRAAPGIAPRGPILDPAAGHGEVLLALLEALAAGRRPGLMAAAQRLHAIEADGAALSVARARLVLAVGAPVPGLERRWRRGDALAPGALPEDGLAALVGNPPYGLRREESRALGLKSLDSLGPFILLGRRLRPGGSLAFILSDTFLTVASHQRLRAILLGEFRPRSITRFPESMFGASVATLALIAERGSPDGVALRFETWSEVDGARGEGEADPGALARLPGAPLSPAPPSLLTFLSAPGAGPFALRQRRFLPFSAAVTIKVGIQTGDNMRYLRRAPGAWGRYPEVDEGRVLRAEERAELGAEERRDGVAPSRFEGRCFLPFDAGGKSRGAAGGLDDLWRPPACYIDWSRGAVARMRDFKGPGGRPRSRLQNLGWAFRPAIIATRVGRYSPVFRLGAGALFDSGCTALFSERFEAEALLGLLSSTWLRFLLKSAINHSLNSQARDLERLPLPSPERGDELAAVAALTRAIIRDKQAGRARPELRRDLDRAVDGIYGITAGERARIDAWMAERYPALSGGEKTLGARRGGLRIEEERG